MGLFVFEYLVLNYIKLPTWSIKSYAPSAHTKAEIDHGNVREIAKTVGRFGKPVWSWDAVEIDAEIELKTKGCSCWDEEMIEENGVF